jgi:hypothetical protein
MVMICNSYNTEEVKMELDFDRWMDENFYVIGYNDMCDYYDDLIIDLYCNETDGEEA